MSTGFPKEHFFYVISHKLHKKEIYEIKLGERELTIYTFYLFAKDFIEIFCHNKMGLKLFCYYLICIAISKNQTIHFACSEDKLSH